MTRQIGLSEKSRTQIVWAPIIANSIESNQMKERDQIRSVSDAIRILDRSQMEDIWFPYRGTHHVFPHGLWFRGQPSRGMSLQPSVFRTLSPNTEASLEVCPWAGTESMLFKQFQLRQPEVQLHPRGIVDWLVLMQHYGLPTRLLDWTENILVALFFAASSDKDMKSPGRLYTLGAYHLAHIACADYCSPDIFTPSDYESEVRGFMVLRELPWTLLNVPELMRHREFHLLRGSAEALKSGKNQPEHNDEEDAERFQKLGFPIPLFPARNNARAQIQASVFTLHGGGILPREMEQPQRNMAFLPEPVSLETIDSSEDGPVLRAYGIPAESKKSILDELNLLGVNSAYLFPETEHQARYLREVWRK